MENKKRYLKNALLATTAASLIVTGTGLLSVNATEEDKFLTAESTVGVDGTVATGTDTKVDTGMTMGMNEELAGMIEGVNPEELTLEDESFIEDLKGLVDKVGKDKVDSDILDFLNQSQMKLEELKEAGVEGNGEVSEEYTVTYNVNPAEAITVDGAASVKKGESFTFSVTVLDGYEGLTVTLNGNPLEATGQNENGAFLYQIDAVVEDLVIDITAEKKSAEPAVIEAEADGLTFKLESERFADGKEYALEVGTEPFFQGRYKEKYEGWLTNEAKRAFGVENNDEVKILGYYSFVINDDSMEPVTAIDESVRISVEGLNLKDMNEENYRVFTSGAWEEVFIECDPTSIEASSEGFSFNAIEPNSTTGNRNFSKKTADSWTTNDVIVYGIVKKVTESDKAPQVDYDSNLGELDYPTESKYENTSDEIKFVVENEIANQSHIAKITMIIPETYSGGDFEFSAEDIIGEAFEWKYDNNGWQPGDKVRCEFVIQNNSSYDFTYDENSFGFEISPEIEGLQTSPSYIDGEKHVASKLPVRLNNGAIITLLGTEVKPTDENVANALMAKGYEGLHDLYKYYINYYNVYHNLGEPINSLSQISYEEMDNILGLGDSMAMGTVRETDPVMSEFLTAVFYNYYLEILPEAFEGSPRDYSLASHAREESIAKQTFEEKAMSSFKELKAGKTSEPLVFDLKIEGEANNTYADYRFGFNFGGAFTKVEPTEPEKPNPDPTPDPDPRPEPEEPEEEIEEEETPETGGEEEIEEETTPEVGGEEEIEDEETPEAGNKDDVTDTGVASTMPWLFGLVASMGVAIAELFRRRQR